MNKGGKMKSKILPLALLSVFLLVLFVIGRPLISPDRDAPGLDPEGAKSLTVIYEPEEFSPGGHKAVSKLISDTQKKLRQMSRNKLNERDITEIKDFYGSQGVLTTHKGDNVLGGTAIAIYLNNYRDAVTNLEFKLEVVYVKEFTDILNKPEKKQTKDDKIHVAYLIVSVSFDLNGKPVDPPSGSNWYHIRECEWRNDF
jgi:hypothetical protein